MLAPSPHPSPLSSLGIVPEFMTVATSAVTVPVAAESPKVDVTSGGIKATPITSFPASGPNTVVAVAMAAPLFQVSPHRPATAQFGSMDASVYRLDGDSRLARHPPGPSSMEQLSDAVHSDGARVIIHNLPADTTEQSMRFMFAWTRQLRTVTVLQPDQFSDTTLRTAILIFDSMELACEVQKMYDGMLNPSQDGEMVVEISNSKPHSRPYIGSNAGGAANVTSRSLCSTNGISHSPSAVVLVEGGIAGASLPSVSSPTSHGSSRFASTFQSLGKITPPSTSDRFGTGDVPNLFSPQSPIGNHLSERSRITGKAMIKNESADDDDTGELLLKQSLPFSADDVPLAASGLQRRATAPQLPVLRLAGLSLNTGLGVSSSLPHNPHAPHSNHQPHQKHQQQQQKLQQQQQQQHHVATSSAHASNSSSLSPTILASAGSASSAGALSTFGMTAAPLYARSHYPAANPADQNPPCNTLYVGNLPIDTSEEELKAMFSKQRGYKRLCFRTKSNGPMCFVEFEDVSFATKALNELYGQMLHNSVKGGIRLSFSKNPLGVRSGQAMNQLSPSSMHGIGSLLFSGGSASGFSTANGPPPGLSAPPGLGGRSIGFGHHHHTSAGAASHHAHVPSLHNQQQHYATGPYSPPPTTHSWNSYSVTANTSSPSNSHSGYIPPHIPGR